MHKMTLIFDAVRSLVQEAFNQPLQLNATTKLSLEAALRVDARRAPHLTPKR